MPRVSIIARAHQALVQASMKMAGRRRAAIAQANVILDAVMSMLLANVSYAMTHFPGAAMAPARNRPGGR